MKKIAIIGKKNVGKSSLFNLLTRSKASVSIDYHGYTRDVNTDIAKFKSLKYKMIDTAGIGHEKLDIDYITLKKTWQFIKTVDIILYVSEFGNGTTNLEKNILNTIKNLKKDIIYIVNKVDLFQDYNSNNVINKNTIFISVKKNIGINVLINKIIGLSKNYTSDKATLNKIKISIIGRSNVGKSTLANKLVNSNTMIVWNEPGTTRDNIKLYITKNNKTYNIIDTPGIKKDIKTRLDTVYLEKSIESIKCSDISIVLVDINLLLTKLDSFLLSVKKTHSYIIVFNKCDLVNRLLLLKIEKLLRNKMNFTYLFISSKYGFGINRIYQKINEIKITQEKTVDKNNIKNMLNKIDYVKKIRIKSSYPLVINLYMNKKIRNENKRHIQSLIADNLNNNNIVINFKLN